MRAAQALADEHGVSRDTVMRWKRGGDKHLKAQLRKAKGMRRSRARLDPVRWIKRELKFTPYTWQAELLRILDNPAGPGLLLAQKGAQLGFTTVAMGYALHKIAKGQSAAWFMSKLGEVRRVHKSMVLPAITGSPALSKIKHRQNVGHQTFANGGELLFRGAGSESDFASFTADFLALDEFDKYFSDIEGSGDPVELALDRVQVRGGKILAFSTPSGEGGVLREHKRTSDLHLEFHLGCLEGRCRELFVPSWDVLLEHHPSHPCPHCGSLALTHDRLPDALPLGRWQCAETGAYAAGGALFGKDGEPLEWPGAVSIQASALISPLPDAWAKGVDRIRTAEKSANRLRKMTATTNVRGEFWIESANTDIEALLELRRPFETDASWLVTCGVDVQHDRLEAGLWAWDKNEHAYLLRHDMLPGPTNDPRSGAWVFLSEWLNHHRPALTLIDSGDGARADTVYSFVKQHGRMIYACKGVGGAWSPIFSFPAKPQTAAGLRVIPVGKDATTSSLLYALAKGRVTFPESLDMGVLAQFANIEKRTRHDRRGREIREYVQLGALEAADCFRYAFAAQRLGTRRLHLRLDPSERVRRQRRPTKNQSVRDSL